jgi:hypothetical protein
MTSPGGGGGLIVEIASPTVTFPFHRLLIGSGCGWLPASLEAADMRPTLCTLMELPAVVDTLDALDDDATTDGTTDSSRKAGVDILDEPTLRTLSKYTSSEPSESRSVSQIDFEMRGNLGGGGGESVSPSNSLLSSKSAYG